MANRQLLSPNPSITRLARARGSNRNSLLRWTELTRKLRGADQQTDQTGAGELLKPKQDQKAIPLIVTHPSSPESTLSHPYIITNTDPTPALQGDGHFDSTTTAPSLLHPFPLSPPHPFYALPRPPPSPPSLPHPFPLSPPHPFLLSPPYPFPPPSTPSRTPSPHPRTPFFDPRFVPPRHPIYPPLTSPITATFHHTGPLGRCPYPCMMVRA